jgi:hypothetical protein
MEATGYYSVGVANFLHEQGYAVYVVNPLVTANHLDHTISVLFGNPAGTFSQAPNSQYSVGTNPISIEIGDLNKDGYVDIAVANAGSNLVSVLLGNEAGTFFSAINSPYSVGAGAYSVVIADLNKDGNLDIVTANYRANTVSVLYGTVDGPFS